LIGEREARDEKIHWSVAAAESWPKVEIDKNSHIAAVANVARKGWGSSVASQVKSESNFWRSVG